jgi:putative addiction module component (TIGR02574 family)
MSPNAENIIHNALQLPSDIRALIAEKLLESLDYEEPFELSQEWKAEIERRCQDIDNGTVQLIPGDQVVKDAIARLEE